VDGKFFNAGSQFASEVWTGEIDDASRFLDDESAHEACGAAGRKRGNVKTQTSEIKIFKVEARYRLTEIPLDSVEGVEQGETQAAVEFSIAMSSLKGSD
jgi:hypothetical protein